MNKAKQTTAVQILDVVALTEDIPFHQLVRGQLGTVVEILSTGAFEVEFEVSLEISTEKQNVLLTLRYDQVTLLRSQSAESTFH